MLSQVPTILIVTADDSSAKLNKLLDEGKEIQRTLNSVQGREYEIVLLPDASINDIIAAFKVPNRAIEILHFAGHADSKHLQLTDGNAEADILANKIKQQGTIKLVFLNGCATMGQVRYFHAAGVPFVIATSRKVGDNKAYWMGTQLYQYLSLKRSLRQAMEEVVTDAKMLKKKIRFPNDRGLLISKNNTALTNDEVEWTLYAKSGHEGEDYHLPFSLLQVEGTVGISHQVFLEQLMFALKDLDSPNLSEIKNQINYLDEGSLVSDGKKTEELLKVLPFALGVRLRQLTAKPSELSSDYYRELLYDYVVFFETLLYYTVAILSAQIWQDKEKAFAQIPGDIQMIRQFLLQNRLTEASESYIPVIEILVKWLQEFDPEANIPVGENLLAYLRSEIDEKSSEEEKQYRFEVASNFFFLQKQYYWQRVRLEKEEAIKNCVLSQRFINNAFQHFTFLLKYSMVSVRGIKVMNFRHLPSDFNNFKNNVATLIVNDDIPGPMPGKHMMENKSVLAFLEAEPATDASSLNLFPFFIDRNVFTGKPNNEVDLYLFIGYFSGDGEEEKSYHFVSVQNPGKVWRFNTNARSASLLHIGEETTAAHEQNHLMANPFEFKKYLKQYRQQFLELTEL